MPSLAARAMAAAGAAVLGACASTTPEWSDVDFARGCWIQRLDDGRTHLARLAPMREFDAALEGDVSIFATDEIQPESRLHFWLTRSSAAVHTAAYRRVRILRRSDDPPAWASETNAEMPERGIWTDATPPRAWLILQGGGDRLVIRTASEDGRREITTWFDGVRDGCD